MNLKYGLSHKEGGWVESNMDKSGQREESLIVWAICIRAANF